MTEPAQPETPLSPSTARAIRVLYLAHLAIPLFLIIDILVARSLGYIHFAAVESDAILLGICALWLLIGLGAWRFSRDRARFLRRVSGPLTGIYALLFCVLLFEFAGRIVLTKTARTPAIRPPGTRLVSDADPAQTPGIQGRKTFTVNEIGLRGPAFPNSSGVYKIVTIGGSTTECTALDDSEEWPHLMMEELNAREKKYPVWVGNAGVSGHNTVHHLALLQSLPVLRKSDLLIFLIGVNDLGATLAFEGGPTESHLEREAQRFRDSLLSGGSWEYKLPLYKHLAVFRVMKKSAAVLAAKFRPEGVRQEWKDVSQLRERRQNAATVPLPDLHTGLEEYRERVSRLARECQTLQVRCLFLTQPGLWRSDLRPEEQRLLWMGNVGRWENPKGYVSAGGLAKAMDAYNRVLLDVCRQDGLECFDLAVRVPKDTSAFYDDQHFNEQGARIVAEALLGYLLSKPPFADEKAQAALR